MNNSVAMELFETAKKIDIDHNKVKNLFDSLLSCCKDIAEEGLFECKLGDVRDGGGY